LEKYKACAKPKATRCCTTAANIANSSPNHAR
jgi:hypothetical protein